MTTVDTTCPWVSKVWTTVDKHQLSGMTSLIHGKYQHEEVRDLPMSSRYPPLPPHDLASPFRAPSAGGRPSPRPPCAIRI